MTSFPKKPSAAALVRDAAACSILIERMEQRTLLSATVVPTSYLIDCGGTAPYTDHVGQQWSPDVDYTGGIASDNVYAVPGTADGTLYCDRRTGQSFAYNLPLQNGAYTLQVFFSDPIYSSAGQRVFNVSAQGNAVLNNFDVIGAGGGIAPISRTFPVVVANGELNVGFVSDNGVNATVSAIKVTPQVVTSPTPTPAPTPTPTPTPAPTPTAHPYVLNVSFGSSTSPKNVTLNADVAVSIEVVHPGSGIDGKTLTPTTVELYPTLAGPTEEIKATYNVDGAGGAIVVQPVNLLQPNTPYTLAFTSGVKDQTGATLIPYTVFFTTGTGGLTPDPKVKFTQIAQAATVGHQYTDIVTGPDGRLWASTYDGSIYAFPILASGNLGTPQLYASVKNQNGGAETITGLTFDPASTATNLILWVDESQYLPVGVTANDFSGKIAMLSGPNLWNYQDMVTGLPRSVGNHMTNQSSFGPDGALYVSQAANTAMGGPDPIWGNRGEHKLNAAILRVDTKALQARVSAGEGPLNVQTSGNASPYNPYAVNAAVTLYATGVRNAYDITWINGHLYAPSNGSAAGGNIQVPAGEPKLGITNVPQTEYDFLFEIRKGGYYGHPVPARGQYILNGGNVDGNTNDPTELPEYPLGTKPDPNYVKPMYTFGLDYSPDGIIQYHGSAFGGALNGHVLVTRYSAGKDILDMTFDAAGDTVTHVYDGDTGTLALNDPLSLTESINGDLFVVEYGGAGDIVRLSTGAPASRLRRQRLPPC